MKPPKSAPSKTLSSTAMFGPMLPEGVYTYELVKGDSTYQGHLEIVADPSSPHSAADRALQQRTAMRLYHLTEHAAYLTAAASELRDTLDQLLEEVDSGSTLHAELNDLHAQVSDYLDSLTVTAILDQGLSREERLREEIASLYSAVSNFGGRPSQSQLDRMEILIERTDKSEAQLDSIISENLAAINAELASRGMQHVKLLTREEFDKRSD
jgi:uncharacterized protein YyaL (SSP411 family)